LTLTLPKRPITKRSSFNAQRKSLAALLKVIRLNFNSAASHDDFVGRSTFGFVGAAHE
jgi:hypothetical protein